MEKNPKFDLGDQIDHDQELDPVDLTMTLRPPGPPPPPTPAATAAPVKQEPPETSSAAAADARTAKHDFYVSREVAEWWAAPPAVKAAVESCGGYSALNLGWHKLAAADFGPRLVVKDSRVKFWMLFRAAEREAAEGGGDGAAVVGVDAGKRVYPNLRITTRSDVVGVVVEKEWSKVIGENKPKVGEVVEFWGFRGNEKPCLALHFREESESDRREMERERERDVEREVKRKRELERKRKSFDD